MCKVPKPVPLKKKRSRPISSELHPVTEILGGSGVDNLRTTWDVLEAVFF